MTFVRRLIWDSWNVAHIARHGVTRREVEEVCHGRPISREAYASRIMVIGPTRGGRIVAAVLEPEEEGAYYVVTARLASRRERRLYQQESR